MADPIKPTAADWQRAVAETNRLQRELDITNADHIALWLDANTIPDEPMNQCGSWLACRIVEAHEVAAQQARAQALKEAGTRLLAQAETWRGLGYHNRAYALRDAIDRALKEQPPC